MSSIYKLPLQLSQIPQIQIKLEAYSHKSWWIHSMCILLSAASSFINMQLHEKIMFFFGYVKHQKFKIIICGHWTYSAKATLGEAKPPCGWPQPQLKSASHLLRCNFLKFNILVLFHIFLNFCIGEFCNQSSPKKFPCKYTHIFIYILTE